MSNDVKEPLNNVHALGTASSAVGRASALPKTARTLTGPKIRGDVPTVEKKEVKRILPVSTRGRLTSAKNANGRGGLLAPKGTSDGSEPLRNGQNEKQPMKNVRIGGATTTRGKVDGATGYLNKARFQNVTAANPSGSQTRAEPAKAKPGSSGNGVDAPSRHEVLAHLKRLTEEHAKLQTEYARVRTLLQDANIKSSSRIGSPIPGESNGVCSAEGLAGNGASSGQLQRSESEKGVTEENDEIEGSVSTKDGFRREVLRLKEELLAAQQQLTCVTEAKSMIEQEQAQLLLKHEETGQEILARESLIEQLSRQVVQLKSRMNMQKAEHMQQMEEIEEAQAALSRRLKEVENESRETKEFMQDENNSLSEALREAEDRAECYQLELNRHQYTLETKEKHCQVLSQVVEQVQTQLRLLQSELTDTKDGAKQLLLKQGAELGECSEAIGHIRELAEEITKSIISNAEELGVDVGATGAAKKRRSSDGRKLVWAILQAASTGESRVGEGDRKDNATNGNATISEGGYSLTAQMKEVEEGVRTLGRIQRAFNQFLFEMLNEVESEKITLEKDLGSERKRLDEMQTELEENVRRRWTLEEKSKELVKELMETKDNLKESHESIREMWDKIDEKANWLIENKKLKEEVDLLTKQNKLAEGKVNLLTNELQETVAKYESAKQGDVEPSVSEYVNKQMALKDEILKLQHLLLDREEDLQEKARKHERHQKVVNGNLQKAEQEVKKLDGIIDHILNVLKDAADLQAHPILKQLWDDLDGETFVNGTVV